MAMNLIRRKLTLFTPISKFVFTFLPVNDLPISPKYVPSPVVITNANAEPLITLVPIKARLFSSKGLLSLASS